ncbi:MAG: hypothetical protein FWH10_09260 [Oscillospiraceae bacterium]|nr:hypothetical protein [Oscillospiraceae bacterium]
MAFDFKIPKPKDMKKALASAKQEIAKSGGMFSGDEAAGRFSGSGVEGNYRTGNNFVAVTITRKPLLYPESAVKSTIADYFRE